MRKIDIRGENIKFLFTAVMPIRYYYIKEVNYPNLPNVSIRLTNYIIFRISQEEM